MTEFIQQYIADLYTAFSNPEKRVFIGYLLSAAVIALLWLVIIGKQRLSDSVKVLFSKQVWLSRSAKSDYLLFLFNRIFMQWLAPKLIGQLVIATSLFFWLHELFDGRTMLLVETPGWLIGMMFTFCFFLVDDFSRYFVHQQMHRWPILWAFHKVHHSAETLTPLTVFRTHPVEAILFSLRNIVVQAVMISTFVFFFADRADLITILGANVIIFTFNVLGSNLRHSHIPIYYWKSLEKILLSPAQHQIHHSVEQQHWNKNYGVVLAIWDRLGGSHHHSERTEKLTFGLHHKQTPQEHTLYSLYITPCIEALNIFTQMITNPAKYLARLVKRKPKDNLFYE